MKVLPVVDCEGCGVCCLHMGYPAFNLTLDQLSDPDRIVVDSLSVSARADLQRWLEMPESLRVEVLGQMREYEPPADGQLDGACIWQDPQSRLCGHHQHRPQVCRDFAIGSSGCRQWRDAYSDRI